ncbi:MAG: helix-turn-helix transcriptional regulator [Nitrospira sp.]|nr:helix-turn-helix transcriptional regulator [Nitrospira sp.]
MRGMMNNIRKELGERIRELRKIAGITQEELGEKSELSYKFIGELERGQVNVSVDSIARIADALGVKIGDLFFKEKIPVQKILIKEKSPLSKFSPQDLQLIKKALRLLNRTFSKV